MKNRWTLHVEDFGNITSADIEIAPMMLFVGRNNTGKSYLASLLWGIVHSWYPYILSHNEPSQKTYAKCKELFFSHFEKKQTELDKEFILSIISFFNECLKDNKDQFVRQILSYDDLKIGELSIAFGNDASFDTSVSWIEYDSFIYSEKNFYYKKDEKLDNKTILMFILSMIKKLLFEEMGYPTYLPASRTGFMVSYKSLTADSYGGFYKKEIQTTLTMPNVNFLETLIRSETSPARGKYADIAESLEKHILKGKIIQNSQIQSFYYVSDSSLKVMPLHTTSSLVTELAPLVIFLKDKSNPDSLIFEEPESHLHLEAQRILARHLVKLVNRGLPVWITTHSDTMFQQFNNLIASTEKRIRKLKSLSYQDDEIIKPEDMNAYQFDIADDGMTDVVPLKLTEDGFVAPTFNKPIIELSKEAIHLEAENEDAD